MSATFVPLYGTLYGSLYFAAVLSTAFYGVACMQTFFYYVHYQNDPVHMKIFVAIMWTLNTIHEALSISGAYKYIIAGLESPLAFVDMNPEIIFQFLMTTLVAVLTQGFLVHRIYVFSGKNIVGLLIWVVLILVAPGQILTNLGEPKLTTFFEYQPVSTLIYFSKALYNANGVHVVEVVVLTSGSLEVLTTMGLSFSAGVDVLIAICMTYLLVRERSATSFASTAHILQRLTVFSVNTGIWTATFAVLSIILLYLFPRSTLYAVFTIPLCSIYCNTLLANLNARAYIRGEEATLDVRADLVLARRGLSTSDNAESKHQEGTELFSPAC